MFPPKNSTLNSKNKELENTPDIVEAGLNLFRLSKYLKISIMFIDKLPAIC